MNPDSQSTLSGTSYTQYTNKISELAAQATPITASQLESNTQWYLQAGRANTFGTDSSETDTNKYPEGKIWVCSDYVVLNNNPITIHGKGTIILTGATINPTKYDSTNNVYYYPLLDVYSGTKIVKANPNGDSDTLGIIAYNQNQANKEPYIWFAGNNEIHAAVFSSVTFSDGPVGSSTSNSKFYGSFVAPKFSFSTNNDDQFYYDYKFDNNWPPGFRYLNMPRPKESN
jgi:hypothetical protein